VHRGERPHIEIVEAMARKPGYEKRGFPRDILPSMASILLEISCFLSTVPVTRAMASVCEPMRASFVRQVA